MVKADEEWKNGMPPMSEGYKDLLKRYGISPTLKTWGSPTTSLPDKKVYPTMEQLKNRKVKHSRLTKTTVDDIYKKMYNGA